MLDQPDFATRCFPSGAPETWRALAKDWVIGDGQGVREFTGPCEVP